jgi:hypothetical protein
VLWLLERRKKTGSAHVGEEKLRRERSHSLKAEAGRS